MIRNVGVSENRSTESQMTSFRLLIVALALLVLTSCGTTGSAPLPASSNIAAEGVEERVVSYVNAKRGSVSKPTLTRNARLDSMARALAARLAEEGQLTHSGFQARFAKAHAETGATQFGENAHCVPPGGDPARRLVEEWLASRIHRNNILNGNWNLTGVGAATDKSGRIWAVQVFASAP